MSASSLILNRLESSPVALAVHELNIMGVSDNAAATRLSELAHDGKVIGTIRNGTHYKEWRIVEPKSDSTGRYIFQGVAA